MAQPDMPGPAASVPAASVPTASVPTASVPAASTSAAAVVRVRDPGELVLAVPVMLGFHPRASLVLMATGGASKRRLGLTLRADLPPPEHRAEVAVTAAQSLLLGSPVGAAVIVVDERGAPGAGPPHRDLVDLVVGALEDHGVDVHTALWAESTAAGARWACYDPCGCGGVLPDPSAGPIAAAAVAGGQVVYAERAELERLVAPVDPERIRRREELLIRAVDEAVAASGSPWSDPEPGTAVVDAALADAAAGRLHLDDEQVLALAVALTVPAVRDTAVLRCLGPEPAAAEQLWAALARETPDPEAAEPAALLAVSALLRGDGALANVALDRAEQAWPGHRLTGLLRCAASVAVRPDELRGFLSGQAGTAGQDGAGAGPAGGPGSSDPRPGGLR